MDFHNDAEFDAHESSDEEIVQDQTESLEVGVTEATEPNDNPGQSPPERVVIADVEFLL